jgi:MFS transporter, putative metabolite:H+ symporter
MARRIERDTVDLPLIQEFMPAAKRGWVSALVTTLLPAGSLLGALVGAYLAPIVGWRGLFLIGLLPIVLVLMVRFWVPESPRWLISKGRHEEARQALAWALQVDPKQIELPATLTAPEKVRWRELFIYPRSVAAGCLTGLTQTGGVGLFLWGATLFTLVLGVSPVQAAFLYIWVSVAAVISRFIITGLIEPLGRRGSGILCCVGGAVTTVLAGYLYDAARRCSTFWLSRQASSAAITRSWGLIWPRSGRPGSGSAAWGWPTAPAISARSSARWGWR